MAYQMPNIAEILQQKISSIQSRLPLRMSVPVRTENSFSAALMEASQSTTPSPSDASSGQRTATEGVLDPLTTWDSLDTLMAQSGSSSLQDLPGVAHHAFSAVAGIASWPRLTAEQLQKLMPRVDAAIEAQAGAFGLDPLLMRALIKQESSFQPFALSHAGAMGLTQLMPGTAQMLGLSDPYDVEQNIRGGAQYLKEQLDAFDGNLSLALAAYNAGPGAVTQHAGIPPYAETQGFVDKVLTYYNQYRLAQY